MSAPPPSYGQGSAPVSGGYYPPPPGNGQHQNYQQPIPQGQSYPLPPSSPGFPPQQSYPPPPSQGSPGSHGGYPPPPPPQQQYAETAHRPSYQPGLQSPPIQSQPSYLSETASNAYTEPPPTGGYVGHSQSSMDQEKPLNTDQSSQMSGGAPTAAHFTGVSATQDDIGTFNGGSYRISHRDSNTILTLQLAKLAPLNAKPGVMISMSPSITLKGAMKFSIKKIISGSVTISEYKGPGEILMAPPFLGDITTLRIEEGKEWNVGKDAFLAATVGVQKEVKGQGSIGNAMLSGEGYFVYRVGGTGIMWISSFGAIVRKDLQSQEKYIVDNGHLVAWNCAYVMERAASGGLINSRTSGEGWICKFTGPGAVFIQTRNPREFAKWMGANAAQV